jgi:hypothetical protein
MIVRPSIPLFMAMAFMSGCVTIAGNTLRDVERTQPAEVPKVEQTIGDFSFHLDGGKMITSIKAGRIANDEILKRWKKWGYISSQKYKKDGAFSATADYEVTLSGTQKGDSSIFLQLISGFSLMVIPYYVDTQLHLVYEVRDRRSGKIYTADVSDSYNTIVSLLLVPVSPFALGGGTKTWDRIAGNLYEQLRAQGAFGGTARQPAG